jgi:hypothetical protein
VSWTDYFSSGPSAKLYPKLYLNNAGTKVVPIADFFADAAAGALPARLPEPAGAGAAAGQHGSARADVPRYRSRHHPVARIGQAGRLSQSAGVMTG